MFKLCRNGWKNFLLLCQQSWDLALFSSKKLLFKAFFLSLLDIQNFLLLSTLEGSCSFVNWCEFCHYSSSLQPCFPSKPKEKLLELNKPWHSVRSVLCKHCHCWLQRAAFSPRLQLKGFVRCVGEQNQSAKSLKQTQVKTRPGWVAGWKGSEGQSWCRSCVDKRWGWCKHFMWSVLGLERG